MKKTGEDMNQNDVASAHKDVKKNSYWDNLVGGGTAAYKEKKIDELLQKHRPAQIKNMIDIGCGTCELLFHYQNEFQAQSLVCMDYDKKVIDFLKAKYPQQNVEWLVADVFELGKSAKKYDLVFLLDVVHEVYSFYGRPNRELNQPIDRSLGLKAVEKLFDNVCEATNSDGVIIITDNVLTEEDKDVRVKMKTPEVIKTVQYFLENYPTRKIANRIENGNELVINSRDLCILLTQYNKIKNQNWDRWNVEKMETHQYYSLSEYRKEFAERGFTLHAITETPADAALEWNADFEMIEGLPALPTKRITLLAKKNLVG